METGVLGGGGREWTWSVHTRRSCARTHAHLIHTSPRTWVRLSAFTSDLRVTSCDSRPSRKRLRAQLTGFNDSPRTPGLSHPSTRAVVSQLCRRLRRREGSSPDLPYGSPRSQILTRGPGSRRVWRRGELTLVSHKGGVRALGTSTPGRSGADTATVREQRQGWPQASAGVGFLAPAATTGVSTCAQARHVAPAAAPAVARPSAAPPPPPRPPRVRCVLRERPAKEGARPEARPRGEIGGRDGQARARASGPAQRLRVALRPLLDQGLGSDVLFRGRLPSAGRPEPRAAVLPPAFPRPRAAGLCYGRAASRRRWERRR